MYLLLVMMRIKIIMIKQRREKMMKIKTNANGVNRLPCFDNFYNVEKDKSLYDVLHGHRDYDHLMKVVEILVDNAQETIEEVGGCDHSVGICYCELIGAYESGKELLRKIAGDEPLGYDSDAVESAMELQARGIEGVVLAEEDEDGNVQYVRPYSYWQR